MEGQLNDLKEYNQEDLKTAQNMSNALEGFTKKGATKNLVTEFITRMKKMYDNNQDFFNAIEEYAKDMTKLEGDLRTPVRDSAFEEGKKGN